MGIDSFIDLAGGIGTVLAALVSIIPACWHLINRAPRYLRRDRPDALVQLAGDVPELLEVAQQQRRCLAAERLVQKPVTVEEVDTILGLFRTHRFTQNDLRTLTRYWSYQGGRFVLPVSWLLRLEAVFLGVVCVLLVLVMAVLGTALFADVWQDGAIPDAVLAGLLLQVVVYVAWIWFQRRVPHYWRNREAWAAKLAAYQDTL